MTDGAALTIGRLRPELAAGGGDHRPNFNIASGSARTSWLEREQRDDHQATSDSTGRWKRVTRSSHYRIDTDNDASISDPKPFGLYPHPDGVFGEQHVLSFRLPNFGCAPAAEDMRWCGNRWGGWATEPTRRHLLQYPAWTGGALQSRSCSVRRPASNRRQPTMSRRQEITDAELPELTASVLANASGRPAKPCPRCLPCPFLWPRRLSTAPLSRGFFGLLAFLRSGL